MIVADIAQYLLAGFLMGFLIYFTGVGGGVLVVPILIFFFALPAAVAVGTAAAYSLITKIMAGGGHWRAGNVNAALFKKIMFGAAPAALAAAGAVNYSVSLGAAANASAAIDVTRYLEALIIVVIIVALALTALRARGDGRGAPAWAVGLMGVFIGAAMGATGIGGGVLIIPALYVIGGATPKQVVGTSVLIALCLSALTAAVYAGGGQFDWRLALWMSVGSLAGVPLAARLFRRVSDAAVLRCVLTAMAAALALMILRWTGAGLL